MAYVASCLARTRSAWGEMMADIGTDLRGYKQINLNTGVSLGLAVMFAGSFYWSAGIKQDVAYHDVRILALETTTKEQRSALDSMRLLSAQAETRLENRLTRIEIMLQDVQSRLVDRDRRSGTPSPPP